MSDNGGMSEPRGLPIAGSIKTTWPLPLAEGLIFQQPPPMKLFLFVNDEGLVDAEYGDITEAALALIEEVRRVQVKS